MTKRDRRHQRAEACPVGVPSEGGEGGPRLERGARRSPDRQQVITAEDAVEAGRLGGQSHGQHLLVAGALLRLQHHAQGDV